MAGLLATVIVVMAWKKLLPFVLLLFVIAMRNIDFDRVAKITFVMLTIFLISVVSGSYFNLVNNFAGNDGRISLGFAYQTYLSHFFLEWVFLFLYLYSDKVNIFWTGFICAIDYYIFYNTKTRNSFLLVILVMIVFLFCKKISLIKNLLCSKICAECSVLIALLISTFMLFMKRSNSIMVRVFDSLLSGRLSIMERIYREYGIPLFGTNIEWFTKSSYNFIDNSFYYICLFYGSIFLIIITAGIIYMMYCLRKEGNYIVILIWDITLLHSLFDPQLIQLAFNPFILLIGVYLWKIRHLEKESLPK
jgi:hypothetical protein